LMFQVAILTRPILEVDPKLLRYLPET